ncbi:MAG: choice-of-anchor D domain-containing protein [Acidobacteriia bacterium]|nr:choice-of-anchor D domain-containing protein [Terriglobia bacterium]
MFDGDLCYSWGSACTTNGSGGWVYGVNNGSPGNGMYNITFPFRGNHDNSASGWDSYFNGHAQATVTAIGAKNFSYYSSDGANRTYSFDYGNSHFVGIDMPGGDISTMTSGQITWLDSDITAAEGRGVTHTFILTHGPIYYINEHSSTPSSSLITVMNKHASISATFHGHEHVLGYVHIDSSRISGVTHPWEELVSGGAGAPVYSCASGRSDYCTSNLGFMTVDVNGNSFTASLYLKGQSTPAETWGPFTKSTPTVTLTPASVSFGNQTVGTTSTAKAVTLDNGTAAAVTISGIAIGGTNPADFAVSSKTCGSSLAAGASCTINVTFTPASAASFTGTLTVTDSAGTQSASLSGTGVAAATTASVSPASLTFPSTTVGSTSAAQSSTLTNTGSSTLTINSITVSGDFAETSTCGSTLVAGAHCVINVTFHPAATGTRTGTVTVSDNASNGPQTISLSGTGASSGGGGGGGLDYYVSPTGSDSSGNGSSTSPWATIQFTSTKIGPGATVHVAPGTYTGNITTNTSGTSSARITYISDTPWGAKLVGPPVSGTMNLNLNVWDNEGSYVTIQGFDVSGAAYQGIGIGGSNVIVKGNHVHNIVPQTCDSNGGAGINAGNDSGSNVDVINNVVDDVGNFSVASVCSNIHGIYHHGTGGHIWNNLIYHNWGFGIQLWGTPPATNVTISSNTVFNNGNSGFVVGTDGSTPASGMLVTNNIFIHNGDYGFEEQGLTGSNQYVDNLSYANAKGASHLQTGTQSGALTVDPLLVNYQPDPVLNLPSDGDAYYKLQSSSPAINAGTSQGAPTTDLDGNTRPQGSGYDIGAYEYMGTPSGSVTLSPNSLTFASQAVGTPSSAQAVTLTNSQSTALTITSIAFTGTNPGDFAQTNTCGSSLAANGSCSVNVTFTPTASGTRSATLAVTDNGPGSPQTISLTGTGASSGSTVTISPNPLTFASTLVGSTSAVETSTLTNNSSSALTITAPFTIDGDFAFGGTGNCPGVGGSVPAGGSCTISAVFTPTATGARTGTVTVFDSLGSQTLSLTGTGPSSTAPVVSLSPTQLSFTVSTGTPSASAAASGQSVILKNTGGAPLLFSSVSITAPFAQTNNCVPSLAAGATCTFSVTFVPQHSGNYKGSLVITDNAPGSPQSVALSGRAKNFKMAGGGGPKTLSAGGSATFAIAITPEGGFNDPVSLDCTGAPAASTCTVSPSTVTPDGTDPVTTTVTLQTTARAAIPFYQRTHRDGPPLNLDLRRLWPLWILLASGLFGLTLLRGQRQWRPRLALAVTCPTLLALAACGGGGGQLAGLPSNGTPAGTYALAVTGTGGGITQAVALTVVIQ